MTFIKLVMLFHDLGYVKKDKNKNNDINLLSFYVIYNDITFIQNLY